MVRMDQDELKRTLEKRTTIFKAVTLDDYTEMSNKKTLRQHTYGWLPVEKNYFEAVYQQIWMWKLNSNSRI